MRMVAPTAAHRPRTQRRISKTDRMNIVVLVKQHETGRHMEQKQKPPHPVEHRRPPVDEVTAAGLGDLVKGVGIHVARPHR